MSTPYHNLSRNPEEVLRRMDKSAKRALVDKLSQIVIKSTLTETVPVHGPEQQEEPPGETAAEKTIEKGNAAPTDINVGEDFAGAVSVLKSRLVPSTTDQDITDLAAVIREAQENAPEKKEAFVEDVNRMLEATGYRIRVAEGLARLAMKNGAIQFSVSGKGQLGFKRKFELETVATSYSSRPPRPR